MTVEPVDIGKYVQLVSELASDRFCAPTRAPDYSKYKVRDKELGGIAGGQQLGRRLRTTTVGGVRAHNAHAAKSKSESIRCN
jgi:hypothetical protein